MMHLVLIFVLVAAVQSGACPTMCICDNHLRDLSTSNVYYVTVSCNTYFDNITTELDDTTFHLRISNFNENELEEFFDNLLKEETRLSYLTELTITQSFILSATNLPLSEFSRIRNINLPWNNIVNLPEALLNSSSLQSLDLSNNTIAKIEHQPFRTLTDLESLNLSANSLLTLNFDSFSGLNNLKCLDLSINNLTSLDSKLFSHLSSLQYLNISNNHLEILNEKCFTNLLKLQQLDVSNNRLIRVELGNLQLPSLARLLLAGNPNLGISREPILLGTGQHLQTVDASRIGLKQVPAALTHSIRTLRLAGNSIKTVRCGDLDSYPLLQLLDFNSNNLILIEDDALGRLDSLNILYATQNKIKEIPKSLPEKLKVLHLEHNKIDKISSKDLQGLPVLEVLLLNDNKIRVVEEEAFSQLGALVTLDLSRNPIKILTAGCLSGPTMLQVLRLSDISVVSPAKEVSFPLSTTEHLITLDLSHSPGLARQLLADTAALAASRELQELDLSFTALEYIRSDLLHYLPQLRMFHIDGNRLNCTQLEWLGVWMRRQDEAEYKKIICVNPPELWGTLLIDLQDIEPTITIMYEKIKKIKQTATNEVYIETAKRINDDKQDIKWTFSSVTPTKILPVANNETKTKSNEMTLKNLNVATIEFPVNVNSTVTTGHEFGGISSTETSHLETWRLTNVNESQEFPHNNVNRSQPEISPTTNLFIASKVKTFNSRPLNSTTGNHHHNKLNELSLEVSSSSVTLDVEVNSNSSHEHRWNASTGEMSMFSMRGGDQESRQKMLHPGMLILAGGIIGAAVALTILAAKIIRRRKHNSTRLQQENDVEISSLPGVTELW